ncbi:MAG: CHAT domain-containing protein [bacterium]
MRQSPVNLVCSGVVFLLTFSGILFSQDSVLQKDYNQTLFLIGQQRYDEANEGLKQIIARDSLFYPAYLKIVEVSKYQSTLDAAEEYFSNGLTRTSNNPYLHHALGLIFRERKQWQSAYQHILKALQLDFRYYPAYRDYVSVTRSTEEAEQMIKQLIEKKPDIAVAYCGLAHIYSLKNIIEKQLNTSQKALQLQPDLLNARFYFAEALYGNGDYEKALKECRRGIEQTRKRNDIESEIDFLNLNGFITNKLGDFARAVTELKQAIDLAEKIGDKSRQSTSLNSMARIHWYVESYPQALQYAQRAFRIDAELGDYGGQASNLAYMGIMHMMLGDYSTGLNHYYQAKNIYKRLGQASGEAVCIGNIAAAYLKLGNHRKALDFAELAIRKFSEFGDGWQKPLANYLRVKGMILKELGEYSEALAPLQHSLQILIGLKTEEHQISNTLTTIGDVYKSKGEYEQALRHYENALKTNPKLWKKGVRMETLLSLGDLYFTIAKYEKAEDAFTKVLRFGKITEDPNLQWRAEAGLALVYKKRGNAIQAFESYTNAIRHIEYIQGTFKIAEEESGFFSDKFDVYAGMVDVLNSLHDSAPGTGYAQRAFAIAQRAKATILLDLLNQDKVFDYLRDVRPGLKQSYRHNKRELEKIHLEISRELTKSQGDREPQVIFNLKTHLAELEREKAQLFDEIKENYPKFHHLTNARILSVTQLQSDVLATNQLLIEFLAGEETLYLWAVTRDDFLFKAIDLSKHELAEKLAHISPLFAKTKQASDAVVDHRWADIKVDLLHELYQVLLEQPLEKILQPGMELIIIPDDILHYFPFEILVTQYRPDKVSYLVEEHPLSYASSASLLQPQGTKEKQASKSLLAFANPDFSGEQKQGIVDWVRALFPFKSVLRGEQFLPLPFAEREVKSIVEDFTDAAVFVHKDATELKFKQTASDYRYIHVATHNLANDQQPMYSKIVLAQQKFQKEDGFLQTYEVFNVNLHADLVVLSGCSTGLGTLRRGEGLIGMSRAFQYAGAENLLVSLWPVNDKSTADLMKAFYGNLKRGMSKARALQQAKIKLIHSEDWRRNPFYWGAFVLIGGE